MRSFSTQVFAVLAAQTCFTSSYFSGGSLSNGRASALGGPRQITVKRMGATVVLYFVEYQTMCVSKEMTTFQSHPTREDAAGAQPSAPKCAPSSLAQLVKCHCACNVSLLFIYQNEPRMMTQLYFKLPPRGHWDICCPNSLSCLSWAVGHTLSHLLCIGHCV